MVLHSLVTFWQFKRGGISVSGSSRLVITSNISAGIGSSLNLCRPGGMWCDAALRIVRKIFSSLWQSVGRERLLGSASTSCL